LTEITSDNKRIYCLLGIFSGPYYFLHISHIVKASIGNHGNHCF